MESQFRPGFDVSQGAGGRASRVGDVAAPRSSTQLPGIILRIVAIVLTFISAVVMGAARQTTTVVGTDPETGLLTSVTGTVKSTYSAAYVYFVVANVLVFFYSVVSLVLSVVNRAGLSSMSLLFSIADLLMVVLLFSSNGAAAAISVVAENGQQNLAGWDKICYLFGGFCARVNAAIVLSMVASVAYVILVVFGMANLRRSL
ncbi:CASP-like protein [Musa troglodytarum]|uniref:CASP-like protein n=1 Tax=Musa troglodytarum TaxID=320322 RepID=A0A9E7FQ91_9LILI|nr:CASP-like protein [Musa troglodytarum]